VRAIPKFSAAQRFSFTARRFRGMPFLAGAPLACARRALTQASDLSDPDLSCNCREGMARAPATISSVRRLWRSHTTRGCADHRSGQRNGALDGLCWAGGFSQDGDAGHSFRPRLQAEVTAVMSGAICGLASGIAVIPSKAARSARPIACSRLAALPALSSN